MEMTGKRQVIPFGRHKGRSVEEVQTLDPQYLEWLSNQAWFAEKYKPIYNIVINNFSQEPEETPAHNAMQVRFLAEAYCQAFAQYLGFAAGVAVEQCRENILRNYKSYETRERDSALQKLPPPEELRFRSRTQFEALSDVKLTAEWCLPSGGEIGSETFAVELKPSMGDDFPAVLPQMHAQQKAARHDWGVRWVLLVADYTGIGATWDEVRAVFKRSGIRAELAGSIPQPQKQP